MWRRRLTLKHLSASLLGTTLPGWAPAATPPRLRVLIPANAGGGWDRTGREFGQALLLSGLVSGVQNDNRGGAAD